MEVLAKADAIDPGEPKAEYDGRFVFTRIRYGAAVDMQGGRFRREPTWMHDFPRADFHFLKILGELTFVPAVVDQGNILTLDDPDLAMFPVAYMSEPGFWTMSDAEKAGLRNYLLKGGFIIFDDFRGNHIQNLEFQMRQVYPEASFTNSMRRIRSFTLFSKSTPSIRGQAITRMRATPSGWGSTKTTTRESD